MDTFTIVVIVILILALLFFGFSIFGSNNSGRAVTNYPSAGQYIGGGCGR